MSIIEQALDKTRGDRRQRANSNSRRANDADTERMAEAQARRAAIDPAKGLIAQRARIDQGQCREQRILLDGSDERDMAAVAAYRMLRTRLLQRARTNKWTTIAVTSAGPNDGKTLTVINLALSVAREKTRDVVLLDLDMRKPSVCRTLGVSPPRELRISLEQGQHLRDPFFTIGEDNLLIAGSVMPTEHASELLASSHFDELLRVVTEGVVNPIVLIDLPPVLLTDDALVVAPKIDAMLVVASEGLTGRAELAKALHLLSEFPIAGVVLNRAAESTPGYDYSYSAGSAENAPDVGR
jgi:Mrp family chromosome partitioning ATPase